MPPSLSLDSLVRLHPDVPVRNFDCGVPDLNDFLIDDAYDYMRALMSVTYVVQNGADISAYFSVLNDSLRLEPVDKAERNRLNRSIPNDKRAKSYPAVKLGRLAVNKPMQRAGFGSVILEWLKIFFLTKNKTGCRFIIVDALNNESALKFYQRNEFVFLMKGDVHEPTRLMYYDLKPFQDLADTANASGSSCTVSTHSEIQS
jgi:GNAT superfamily N-acetyltransferase